MATFDAAEVLRRLSGRLKMRHLILLLSIRQHGSLTRAAEHLASSQPAITNALAELESMFGAPLFDRSVRGMAPTALGEVVLARAKAMVNDLGHLVQDMEAVASGHGAHVHVGVTPFVSGHILAAAMQRAPGEGEARVSVSIHEGNSDQLLAQLRDHTVDIVIGRASSATDVKHIAFEVLYRQTPRLIASRRLAAQLSRGPLNWRALAELDWILGAPLTPIREQVTDLFLSAGLTPPAPVVESHSSKLIGELIVGSSRAVSIVPADIAEELVRIAGVAVVPYSFEWTLPPIAMFMRAQGPRRTAEHHFAAALRATCKSLYGYPAPDATNPPRGWV